MRSPPSVSLADTRQLDLPGEAIDVTAGIERRQVVGSLINEYRSSLAIRDRSAGSARTGHLVLGPDACLELM
jgi:hypothetical protein